MRCQSTKQKRSGLVLLVVMGMLALFASTAIAFVFYADSEAVASNLKRLHLVQEAPDVDPEAIAGLVLKDLLYPTDNPHSALRGWDLARSIFGYNPGALNHLPYNGVGRDAFAPTNVIDPDLGVSVFKMINTQTHWNPSAPVADRTLNFVRTPEYYDKVFFGPAAAPPTPTHLAAGPPSYRFVGGANPPFTAYDTNSLFLAQVRADGTVLMPSFARPWAGAGSGAAAKYMTLRPWGGGPAGPPPAVRQSWHPGFDPTQTGFPNGLPDSEYDPATGIYYDVRNLDFGPGRLGGGNNDSFFIDIGAPIMTAPNGKRYKMLVAPLIMDLSNRVHLWAHNNRLGTNAAHVSNMGLGPTEVNASKVLLNINERQGLMNLIYGGLNGTPASVPVGAVPNLKAGPFYSKIDADALDPGTGRSSRPFHSGIITPSLNAVVVPGPVPPGGVFRTVQVAPTGVNGGFPWYFFDFVGNRTVLEVGNEQVTVTAVDNVLNTFTAKFTQSHPVGSPVWLGLHIPYPFYPGSWGNTGGAELTNNPLALNLRTPGAPNIAPLPVSNMEALLQFGATNSPALSSEIFRRMPVTFANVRTRNMVTLANWHFDRVTGSPFLNFDRLTTPAYTLGASGYPTLNAALNPAVNYANPLSAAAPPKASDYSADWRLTLGNFLRVDLTRPLTDYPVQNAGGAIPIATPAQRAAYRKALDDRVNMARDLYKALIRVTGARDPDAGIAMAPGTPDYNAARWLAQLAVNIVDYIDNDDYITPFNWNRTAGLVPPEGWVYGTELPRLVLNEVYAQHELNPQSRVNVWAELHNPFATPPAGSAYPRDDGDALLVNNGTGAPVYRIDWFKSTPAHTLKMRQPDNVLGDGNLIDLVNTQATWRPVAPLPFSPNTLKVAPANGSFTNAGIVTRNIAADNPNPALAGARDVGGVVTIRLQGAWPGFVVGQAVTITGVQNNPLKGPTTPLPDFEGTFVITGTNPKLNTFTYLSSAGGGPAGGGGTATSVPTNPNTGFYVIAPDRARYAGAARNPKMPATFASQQMSALNNSVAIKPAAVPGISRAGNVVTVDTIGNHGFSIGQWVTITNAVNPQYNGTWQITGVPSLNTFTFTSNAGPPNSGGGEVMFGRVSMLLRRLANPHLPADNNPGSVTYNPYVSVDYVDDIPITSEGANVSNSPAYGRRQPYAAFKHPTNPLQSQVVAQIGGLIQGPAGQPVNSFFSHNGQAGSGTIDSPFDWLVHLDRAPVNPIELLHVSGFKPHELTQQFVTPAGKFQHYAPWGQPGSMISRLLDQTSSHYMNGLYTGGRFPGNINLNTMTEPEIFQALCDAHDAVGPPANQYRNPWFNQNDVDNVFARIVAARQAGTPEGTPFRSFSAGDPNLSYARKDASGFVFQAPSAVVGNYHPYAQFALLQKVYNNISTTSNVFAVWFTVGFFEVVDETVRPARLGAEIGRAENRHIRHRFFAIVDRSAMKVLDTNSQNAVVGATSEWNRAQSYQVGNVVVFNGVNYVCTQNNTSIPPSSGAPTWAPVVMNVPLLGTTPSGQPITLQPGMLLEIDSGTASAEVVAVTAAAGNSFMGNFRLNHNANARVVLRGNPGPLNVYNPRRDSEVVLHLSVIQ